MEQEDGSYSCPLRNRTGWRVYVSKTTAEKLPPYDLFLDKAGRVVCQDVKGRRRLLTDFGTYEVRQDSPLHLGRPQ